MYNKNYLLLNLATGYSKFRRRDEENVSKSKINNQTKQIVFITIKYTI